MAARVTRTTTLAAVLTAGFLLASPAHAHWCDDNWGSAYNLVVRPAQDTVTVPPSGNVTLDVYVQNNIGEALPNFSFFATASGYTINISSQNGVRPGWLMPGEKLRQTLTISRSGGGSLQADAITYTVSFGTGGQSSQYGQPSQGRDVVVKMNSGATSPATKTGIDTGNFQARHLQRSARADYGSAGEQQTGIDELMELYCLGPGSWDGSGSPRIAYVSVCPDHTYVPTTCPTGDFAGSKYDYQQLWAAQELASRKSVLDATRLTAFRARLKCGYAVTSATAKYLAGFILGYLGADADARTFLLGKVALGGDEGTIAKAALLLHGNAADRTAYHADVAAGMTSSSFHVSAASAASLGIVDTDDGAVTTYLLPKADWIEPDTSDNGKAYFAAQLLALVAWARRGYAPDAGDTGNVSFYSGTASDTTPPQAPAGVTCTASAGGTVRVQWNQVTQDTGGQAENVTEYRVYSGNAARTAGCTAPGCATDYSHSDAVGGSTFRLDLPSLDGTQTYYFAVMAVDGAGNTSAYSAEVHCLPVYAPTAVLQCSPTSGDAPLDVTCNATGSSDPNGAADIATRTFALDGQPATATDPVTYNFTVAANHVVLLRVTDQGGLFDTDQVTITVTAAGNTAPTAVAGATPTTGQAPLTVTFTSAGSADPDTGQTLSYAWDFTDGATATEADPSHTFTTAGSYDVLLTVTDDAATPASGFAVVTVEVLGNNPPDVSTASATPLFGPVPLTVRFDASNVRDPDGNTVAVTWDFGDGSATSNALSVDHVYTAAGAVTAHLTATDDYTPPAEATRSFVINPGGGPLENRAPDCAAATVTPATGGGPLTVTLDASGCTDPEGNGMTYLWRIPTSLVTEDQVDTATGTYVFEQDGEVTVTLRVTDDGAPAMSTSREFVVTVGGGVGGRDPITGCVCLAAGGTSRGAPGLLVLMAAGLWLARRRRRR